MTELQSGDYRTGNANLVNLTMISNQGIEVLIYGDDLMIAIAPNLADQMTDEIKGMIVDRIELSLLEVGIAMSDKNGPGVVNSVVDLDRERVRQVIDQGMHLRKRNRTMMINLSNALTPIRNRKKSTPV